MAFIRRRGVRAFLWLMAALGCLALAGGTWIALDLLSALPSLTHIAEYRPPVPRRVPLGWQPAKPWHG